MAVVLVGVCLASTAPAEASNRTARGTDFFSPDSVWNRPLAPSAPVASFSAKMVNLLNQDVGVSGSWINTTNYSFPVYTVASNQPKVLVMLDANASQILQGAFDSVPLPPTARPAGGTDQNLVVWQPSTQTMWEFWGLRHAPGGAWLARWGGKMSSVNTNPGYYAGGFGATATGLAAVGGLITLQEEADGVINHALAVAVPHPMAGVFLAPAQRTDGDTASWNAIPEGTRFRLPANLNVDALHLPRQTAMMAKAVQRFGMIVRDKASDVAFFAEDPYQFTQKHHVNPYGPYAFQNRYPSQLLAAFPWRYLEVVAAAGDSGHPAPAQSILNHLAAAAPVLRRPGSGQATLRSEF